MSAMSFEVLPGRPVGGVFPHTASEWGVVSLSLLGAPAFWNVSRFFGTQEPPLGLARVTEAKHSKPGPALERVRPAGGWGRPDLLTLGPGT